MIMQRTLVIAALVTLGASQVDAYAKYLKLLPNGGDIPDTDNVGHVDAAGQEGVNDFGKAFKAAGNSWTVALCQADTDGDGFTNGQEMGDPCCTWTPTSTASLITDGLSNPNDKTKTPSNAKLIAGCSASGTSGTTTTTTDSKTSSSSGSSAAETINDVLAPVSATSSPTAAGTPTDDDEDDSSESAVVTTTSGAATFSSVAAAMVSVAVAAIAAF